MAYRTDAERLEYLYEIRDALEDKILTTGGAATMIQIRQRTISYANPIQAMEYIKKEISHLEAKSSRYAGGARNSVRLTKPQ